MRRTFITLSAVAALAVGGCWWVPGGTPPDTVVTETEPNNWHDSTTDELPLAPVGFSGEVFSGPGDEFDGDYWERTFPEAGSLTVTCFEGEADLDVTSDDAAVLLDRFKCGEGVTTVTVPVAAGDLVHVIAYSDLLDGIVKTYLVTAEFQPAP